MSSTLSHFKARKTSLFHKKSGDKLFQFQLERRCFGSKKQCQNLQRTLNFVLYKASMLSSELIDLLKHEPITINEQRSLPTVDGTPAIEWISNILKKRIKSFKKKEPNNNILLTFYQHLLKETIALIKNDRQSVDNVEIINTTIDMNGSSSGLMMGKKEDSTNEEKEVEEDHPPPAKKRRRRISTHTPKSAIPTPDNFDHNMWTFMDQCCRNHRKSNGFPNWNIVWSMLEKEGHDITTQEKRAIQIKRAEIIRKASDGSRSRSSSNSKSARVTRKKTPNTTKASPSSAFPLIYGSLSSSPLHLKRKNRKRSTSTSAILSSSIFPLSPSSSLPSSSDSNITSFSDDCKIWDHIEYFATKYKSPSGAADWQQIWPALQSMGFQFNDSEKRAIQIRRADLLRNKNPYSAFADVSPSDFIKRRAVEDISQRRQRSWSSSSSSPFTSEFVPLSEISAVPKRKRTHSTNEEDESAIVALLASGMVSTNPSPRHSFVDNSPRPPLPPKISLESFTPTQTRCFNNGYIHVPNDYKSLNVAVQMAMEISIFEIRISHGVHILETTNSNGMLVRSINVNVPIRFIGEGIQQTIIKGAIYIGGKEYKYNRNNNYHNREHDMKQRCSVVEFHRLTLTNSDQVGVQNDGGPSLLFEDCEVTECRKAGIYVRNDALLTMRRCVIHHNGTNGIYLTGNRTMGRLVNCKSYCNLYSGLVVQSGSRVDIYGENTEIYENGSGGTEGHGIKVSKQGSQVCFHVPNHLRFIQNNYGSRNIKEYKGGRVVNVNSIMEGNVVQSIGNNSESSSSSSSRNTSSRDSCIFGEAGKGKLFLPSDLEKQSKELVAEVLFKSRSNSISEVHKM